MCLSNLSGSLKVLLSICLFVYLSICIYVSFVYLSVLSIWPSHSSFIYESLRSYGQLVHVPENPDSIILLSVLKENYVFV